jgi:hypothetical protein
MVPQRLACGTAPAAARRMAFRAERALCACAIALFAACATQTRYAEGRGDDGYREQRIEDDRWRVSFRGNANTDLAAVEHALLYRAAELTLQQGYEWFRVVDHDTDAKTRVETTAPHRPFYDGFGRLYYHPRFGWFAWHDPFWDNEIRVRERTRYEASAEIQLGRGPKPEESQVYGAREVERNLRGEVAWPS